MQDLLRVLRERCGWTQTDAAVHLGVSRGSLNNWECGRATPSRENLADVIRVYAPTEAERVALLEAAALPETARL